MGLDRCVELNRAKELCLSCTLDDCDEDDPDCAFRQHEQGRQPVKRKPVKREKFTLKVGMIIQERRGGRFVWTIVAVLGDGSVEVDRDGGRRKIIRRVDDYIRVEGKR